MEARTNGSDLTPDEREEKEAIRSDLTEIAAHLLGLPPNFLEPGFLEREGKDAIPEFWDRYREMDLHNLRALRAEIREDIEGMDATFDEATGKMEIKPMKYGDIVMRGGLLVIDFLIEQQVKLGPGVPAKWKDVSDDEKHKLAAATAAQRKRWDKRTKDIGRALLAFKSENNGFYPYQQELGEPFNAQVGVFYDWAGEQIGVKRTQTIEALRGTGCYRGDNQGDSSYLMDMIHATEKFAEDHPS